MFILDFSNLSLLSFFWLVSVTKSWSVLQPTLVVLIFSIVFLLLTYV